MQTEGHVCCSFPHGRQAWQGATHSGCAARVGTFPTFYPGNVPTLAAFSVDPWVPSALGGNTHTHTRTLAVLLTDRGLRCDLWAQLIV